MIKANASKSTIGLVLSGGGARGAYEAGVIHYIRTALPTALAKKHLFDIICGSSVGAINTCFMAATQHQPDFQGRQIFDLWRQLDQDQIYRRGFKGMTNLMTRSMNGLLGNFFGLSKSKTDFLSSTNFTGFLDTAPFLPFMNRVIGWKQISLNIQKGTPHAISVTATNVNTGKMELFIQKNDQVQYTGRHHANYVTMQSCHALASAAIPLLFPAIKIGDYYYCDGGLRLNTPLSPAIQLGADKTLVIGLHHVAERAEAKSEVAIPKPESPPTMGEIVGQVLKSIFLDRLEYDLEQMKRVNRLLEAGEHSFGKEFLTKINHYLSDKYSHDVAGHRFRPLQVLKIFPSQDVRQIFAECLSSSSILKKQLTVTEKLLFKVLDVDLNKGNEFLSFVLFAPAYLKRLLDLGYEDAKSHHDELLAFFDEG